VKAEHQIACKGNHLSWLHTSCAPSTAHAGVSAQWSLAVKGCGGQAKGGGSDGGWWAVLEGRY